jgi:hypothetical protein
MRGVKIPGKMGLPERGIRGSRLGSICSIGIISLSGIALEI